MNEKTDSKRLSIATVSILGQAPDTHEEYMVRKMADLLHVPHLEFIKTKIQVNGS